MIRLGRILFLGAIAVIAIVAITNFGGSKVEVPTYDWYGTNSDIPAIESHAELLALCEQRDDLYFMVVSPSGYKRRTIVESHINHIGPLVYSEELYLPKEERFHFIKSLYGELSEHPAHWTEDDRAVQRHVDKRFVQDDPIQLYLITAPGLDELVAWKRAIRKKLGLGTVAIHCTDSTEETRRLTQWIDANRS